MVENLRCLVAHEEQRLASLTTRGAGFAGFAGLATAVIATASDDVLPLAAKILFVVAASGLVLVAAGIVLGTMATREGKVQSLADVARYRDPASQTLPREQLEITIIDALLERLEALRAGNGARAAWLDRAARLLVVSVLFAAAAAVVRFFA
jgi:hypothetical protein